VYGVLVGWVGGAGVCAWILVEKAGMMATAKTVTSSLWRKVIRFRRFSCVWGWITQMALFQVTQFLGASLPSFTSAKCKSDGAFDKHPEYIKPLAEQTALSRSGLPQDIAGVGQASPK
jgi:hypothetical protein